MRWSSPPETLRPGSLPQMFADTVQKAVRACEDVVPDLRKSRSVIMASDYAGEHKKNSRGASEFYVHAFLIADADSVLRDWNEKRLEFRSRALIDDRRMEYKKLGDGMKLRALSGFLEVADEIHGLLCCVVFDKRITQWTRINWGTDPPYEPLLGFKPPVFEKLVRICHFSSVLVGGLCPSMEVLRWITDEDDIVTNASRRQGCQRMFVNTLKEFTHPALKSVKIGINSKLGKDTLMAEDLTSVCDLAGGGVAEFLSMTGNVQLASLNGTIEHARESFIDKCATVVNWISTYTQPLKKLVLLVSPYDAERVRLSITFLGEPHPALASLIVRGVI